MLTERFTFISLLVLITVSLIVDICLSVASDTPNESVRSVIQTCSVTWKVGVFAVAWRVGRRRR